MYLRYDLQDSSIGSNDLLDSKSSVEDGLPAEDSCELSIFRYI